MSKRVEELLKIISIPKEDVEKLNFREKQRYYKAKSKLGRIIHRSRDKDGNGVSFSYDEQLKGIKNYERLRNKVLGGR